MIQAIDAIATALLILKVGGLQDRGIKRITKMGQLELLNKDYPSIEISQNTTDDTLIGSNGNDDTFGIDIIVRVRDIDKAGGDINVNEAGLEIVEIVEERDVDSKPLASTIFGILLDTFLYNDSFTLMSNLSVQYGTEDERGVIHKALIKVILKGKTHFHYHN